VLTRSSFDYAILRVVPRVERGEFVNAGVVVFCLHQQFLEARVKVDGPRLKALWPEIDVEMIGKHLEAIPRICKGDREAGPIALLTQRERFHWIVSPRSTIIQVSPVHSGICSNPQESLDNLYQLFLGAPDLQRSIHPEV
jgi:hypothetical protein